MANTADQLRKRLLDSRVMTAAELDAFLAELEPPPATAKQLAKALVKSGRLTKYQVQTAFSGKEPLVLGNYVLLDELGAGGMGEDGRGLPGRASPNETAGGFEDSAARDYRR